jgi:type IV secretion system protein VirD4
MSDMLGETTIDTRSETISSGRNGSGSLQNSKAGMKLMTPEQVREMPNRDCILLIEGMKPVYDHKNRPFNTRLWKEAEAAAGKNGYTHPVRVIHDKEKDVYKTVDCEEKILMIDKEEEEFYRNAAKTDKSIHIFDMDEEEFLYLNWDEHKPLTAEELQAIVRDSKKKDISGMMLPEDVAGNPEEEESSKDPEPEEEKRWDLSGSISDCIKRYAGRLTGEELDVILKGLDSGLSDMQIRHLFTLADAEQMERYRKRYELQKRKQQ